MPSTEAPLSAVFAHIFFLMFLLSVPRKPPTWGSHRAHQIGPYSCITTHTCRRVFLLSLYLCTVSTKPQVSPWLIQWSTGIILDVKKAHKLLAVTSLSLQQSDLIYGQKTHAEYCHFAEENRQVWRYEMGYLVLLTTLRKTTTVKWKKIPIPFTALAKNLGVYVPLHHLPTWLEVTQLERLSQGVLAHIAHSSEPSRAALPWDMPHPPRQEHERSVGTGTGQKPLKT